MVVPVGWSYNKPVNACFGRAVHDLRYSRSGLVSTEAESDHSRSRLAYCACAQLLFIFTFTFTFTFIFEVNRQHQNYCTRGGCTAYALCDRLRLFGVVVECSLVAVAAMDCTKAHKLAS